MQNLVWFLEGESAEEEIVNQTEDGGIQSYPDREREDGEESEPRGFEQLTKSKTNIAHRNSYSVRKASTGLTRVAR